MFFFFNDTATTEIYTLSLHDALPISEEKIGRVLSNDPATGVLRHADAGYELAETVARERGLRIPMQEEARSEEHTSELQLRQYLVCRLLLEKKKKKKE